MFILKFISIIFPLLIAVAYLTLAERKILGAFQKRKGPNVVGIYGLLQPFADGIKLILKEIIIPNTANKFIFILSPLLTFFLSLLNWIVMPLDYGVVLIDINLGILYLFIISSLNVYAIILGGWSSNSKYAFLGALRSAAQMISYEVYLSLILINILLCVGSLNLTEIVLFQKHIWFLIPFFPLAVIFFITMLAETNRPPFDLAEAEAELVSGYNVEYSSIGFALFFISEYANIIFISALCTTLFLGGWLSLFYNNNFLNIIPGFWFSLKIILLLFGFIWIRATFPRFRYDQLMQLGWKIFLPITLSYIIITSSILISFNCLPF